MTDIRPKIEFKLNTEETVLGGRDEFERELIRIRTARAAGWLWRCSGLQPQPTRNRRALPALNRDCPRNSRNLAFMDGH
jgi:hypothetical protein